jgi:hypothetical protein
MNVRTLSATLAVGACAALSACGGSDKPAYCSDVSDFKDAVSELTNVQVTKDGVSELTTAVDKVETSGQTLVSSAKSEFAPQTSALKDSLTALSATSKQLANPQTAKAALAAVPTEVKAVKTSFDALSNAAKSKCD